MKKIIWDGLEKLFEEFPFMKADPVLLEEEIVETEKKLGVRFASDYKEFIQKYGGAIVGPFPIYGLRHADPMDDELWSVAEVTMHYRNEGWPCVNDLYIISSDHSDNPVGIRNDGQVISYDHDLGEAFEIAKSFEVYLAHCLGIEKSKID